MVISVFFHGSESKICLEKDICVIQYVTYSKNWSLYVFNPDRMYPELQGNFP